MTYPNQLPREFRMVGGSFGKMLMPFAFLILLLGGILYVLGYVVGKNIGGVVGALVGVGFGVGVLFYKYNRMKQGTVVRFSEYGVELSDTLGFRIRIMWPDITRIGQVNSQMANTRGVHAGELTVSVGPMTSHGIIGWGERVLPPNAPNWMRAQVAAAPRNPYDGRLEVAIPLGGIDPNWQQGPMGQWLHTYRPDLAGGGYPPPQQYPYQQQYPPR